MKRFAGRLVFYLFIISSLAGCDKDRLSITELLESLEDFSAEEQNKRIDQYLSRSPSIPLIEDDNVYFILKDVHNTNIYLTVDIVGWKPDSLQMNRIGKSDYYFLKQTYPLNARLEYKFVVGKAIITDPLNNRKEANPYGTNSVVMMPLYEFPTEVLINKKNISAGFDTLAFKSRILKKTYPVYFYRHPQSTNRTKIVIFHDGQDYLNFVKANTILDNLIADKKIPVVNALFIKPSNRMKEYWFNDDYLKMIFTELIPHIKETYNLNQTAGLGMGGASLGGLISLYALKDYSDELEFVFSQSGAIWIEDEKILEVLSNLDHSEVKVYLGYGSFERMSAAHDRLSQIMSVKDYNFILNKSNEGHNWGNWRAHLDEALMFGLTR